MKNGLKMVVVAVTIVAVVFASYMVADKKAKSNIEALKQTTVTQMEVTEKDTSQIETLFSSEKHDYHIYKQGKTVILNHGGKDFRFENWSKYIDLEKPKVYATDIDRDGELEILIRMVGNVDDKGDYHHYVYALNERYDENGELSYFVITFTQNAILTLIDDKVTTEISQIDSCQKTAVFAMCMNYTTINYDKETNLPDSYYNLFKALQDENGKYLKIAKWSKGLGDFVVKKNCVQMQCPIYVTYENGVKKNIGYIKCNFDTDEENQIVVCGGTFYFTPNEEYKVFSYDLTTNKHRQNIITNKNSKIPNDKIIDAFQYDLSLDFKGDREDDFSQNATDLNCISKIIATESYIDFVAKPGCRFNEDLCEKNQFSIMMTATDKLVECTYDVGYLSTVSTNDEGNEVLRLSFDKAYQSEVTKNTKITFGTK